MKRLHLTIQCMAIYESGIDVPDDMSLEDAIEFAKQHLCDAPLGNLEYVPDSDVLDEENCDFGEPTKTYAQPNQSQNQLSYKDNLETQEKPRLIVQIQSASDRTRDPYSSADTKTKEPER